MTNEEAKNWLNRLYVKADITDEYGDMVDMQPYSEAIDMAIKALEQEPCEDAISRQAVIDSLHSKFADGFDSDRWWNSMSVLYAINKVPSVSTEKTGRWSRKTKVDAYDLCGVKTWGIKCQCDRCTFTTTVVEDFGYYKYCPNCGAKMEVENG